MIHEGILQIVRNDNEGMVPGWDDEDSECSISTHCLTDGPFVITVEVEDPFGNYGDEFQLVKFYINSQMGS